MKINFNFNQNFQGKIVYTEATKKMRWVLNYVSGPKDLDLFGAFEDSIKKMMPAESDRFMFTEVKETDTPNSFDWKAKFIHKGKEKEISSTEPYIASNNKFHEYPVFSMLVDILDAADSLYSRDKNKPEMIIPIWSKFRKR